MFTHFHHLSNETLNDLFLHRPESISSIVNDRLDIRSISLGATLYIPASRSNILGDIEKLYATEGVSSVVVCLEDAVGDDKLPQAEQNLKKLLVELKEKTNEDGLPMIFIRPRSPIHFIDTILPMIEENYSPLINGFVFPKFDNPKNHNGLWWIESLRDFNQKNNTNLLFMPVVESPDSVFADTRQKNISDTISVIEFYSTHCLAVRIGATDMCSAYGVRRSQDFTIYDLKLVGDALTEVANLVLSKKISDNRVVSGAVWEHFAASKRTFKPQLRDSIFQEKDVRRQLLESGYDNFIREIQLDKLNGITGKTVIHPSHVGIVNSLQVVTHEELSDASVVLNGVGGAQPSAYSNKMNEANPHRKWAEKIMKKAKIYGVFNPGKSFIDLLQELDKLKDRSQMEKEGDN